MAFYNLHSVFVSLYIQTQRGTERIGASFLTMSAVVHLPGGRIGKVTARAHKADRIRLVLSMVPVRRANGQQR